MIPLSDINPRRRRPVVVYSLISINLVVFAGELLLPAPVREVLLYRFGFVPYFFSQDPNLGSLSTPVTSMFMHGGLIHLASNMWFLHIFGDNVEDVLGRPRFVLFYLGAGLFAALAQFLVNPESRVPMVGASGAIAGVLGAYFRLFPSARVNAWVFPIFFVELPALFFIFVWFVLQLASGIGSLGLIQTDVGGVAFFAHIGGFLAGLWLVSLLAPRPPNGRPSHRDGGFGV